MCICIGISQYKLVFLGVIFIIKLGLIYDSHFKEVFLEHVLYFQYYKLYIFSTYLYQSKGK